MGRPRKYSELYGAQKAYHQTEKGQAVLKKSQSSDKEKERKKKWWQENKGKYKGDRRQYFIENYGNIEEALNLLSSKQSKVITLVYGLDGNPHMSQVEIAKLLGQSKQAISYLKTSAEKKLANLQQVASN